MQLRPYQVQAREAVFREWERVRSTMLVLPTGMGKTVCFADIASRVQGRVAVFAHSEELVWQSRLKIKAVTGHEPDIEMATYRTDEGMWKRRIFVGTVQTQRRRMHRFDPAEFGAVIIDECHHAAAETYRRIVEHYSKNPACRVLGVTATPDRTDGYALGGVFDSVAYQLPLQQAIDDGWLVPIRQQPVYLHGVDWSGVSTTAGDLNAAELGETMIEEEPLQEIADTARRNVGSRKAITFVPTVAVATKLAEILNRHTAGCAAAISGKTPKDERKAILEAFARRQIQHLVNCMVLTEGFDDPGVECVVLARPTKSRALFAQMVGRGTRALPGVVDGPPDAAGRRAAIAASAKPSVEIIDMRGNVGRHKLVTATDLLGGIPLPELEPEDVSARANEIIAREGRAVTVQQALDRAGSELLEERRRREAEEEAERERRKHLRATARFELGALVDPFDVLDSDQTPEAARPVARPLSEKQLAVLVKQGIDPQRLSVHEQRRMLDEVFRRWKTGQCSYKQAKLLKRHGHPTDVSRAEAAAIIDRIMGKKPGERPRELAGHYAAQPNPEWF